MSGPPLDEPDGDRPPPDAAGSDATTVRPNGAEPETLDGRSSTSAGGAKASAPSAPGLPRISHFEVRKRVGGGTFGHVYLAYDTKLKREVAIKVPRDAGLPADEKAAFLKEGVAAAAIHHANVCPVYEANTHEDLPYIVMRFVPITLETLLAKTRGALPPRTAVIVAKQLALGLAAAHARGVIHRDLKPANVLYDEPSKQVLIADFGLARIVDRTAANASAGGGKGTPLYMPPEQWSPTRWGPVGEHSDVYSLGIILYEMLIGRTPFVGTQLEVMIDHCETVPKSPSVARPGLPLALDELCLKAIAKRPDERYPSAKAFANALTNYLNAAAQKGTSQSSPSQPSLGNVVLIPENEPTRTHPTDSEVQLPLLEEVVPAADMKTDTQPARKSRRVPIEDEPPLPPPPPPPRPARARPVAPRPRLRVNPLVWIVLGFISLVVAGFVLMLLLDRRRPALDGDGQPKRALLRHFENPGAATKLVTASPVLVSNTRTWPSNPPVAARPVGA